MGTWRDSFNNAMDHMEKFNDYHTEIRTNPDHPAQGMQLSDINSTIRGAHGLYELRERGK